MPEKLTNMTLMKEFLLMGFPDNWVLQRCYATLFLLIYLSAVMGNLLIITLTTIDQHLQVPLYFFLKNLSFVDICYISVTVPKSIMNSLTNSHSISFRGCASQVFFVVFASATEYALLIVMSYDRYAAICHPLHYEAIMSRSTCVQMVAASWLSGCIYGSIHVAGTFTVRFCGPNIVHQFFCDIPSLLTLSCYGEDNFEYMFIIASCCFGFICFIFMIISYVHIFSTVLRIPSAQGRFKSFSTCMPHLTVVTLFLSSGFIAYLGSTSKSPSSLNLFMSVLYSLLPPTLNPVIYSLRNRDMKVAFAKMFGGTMASKVFMKTSTPSNYCLSNPDLRMRQEEQMKNKPTA
nr:olfactory receptor 14A16-like [Dasypus novemcinctus]